MSRTAADSAGIATSSQIPDWIPVAVFTALLGGGSVLQEVGVVDRRGPAGPEDRHDDGQADDDLGGGHGHDEERHDLPLEVTVDAGERHERKVHGVEHQLHRHEHHDRVAPDEDADGTDREQRGAQHQVVIGAHSSTSRISPGCTSAGSSARSTKPVGSQLETPAMTDSRATVPSGSSAGVATELPVERTPGPGSGCGRPERMRSRASDFCVGRGPSRSTWARIIAPTAATISSAEVSSNAKRYLVNSSVAIEWTFAPPAFCLSRSAGW